MKMHYSLDDIGLVPASFTEIKSRKDVDTTIELCGYRLECGLISSNMTSVYSPALARNLAALGGISCVHRFCSIEENVKLFKEGIYEDKRPWVSIGVGSHELERAGALINAGARVVVIDLANGACQAAVDQYKALRSLYKVQIVVGNFSTGESINEFVKRAGSAPDLFKVGQGNGSACVTSLRTGITYPAVTCIQECVATGYPIVYDGGVKEGGDLVKMLSLGAKGVFIGRLFAACQESGADWDINLNKKRYRGSAAKSSYEDQGKVSSFRAPEGEEYWIPVSGTVADLYNMLNGSVRSACTYMNCSHLTKIAQCAKLVLISQNSILQTRAYGAYLGGK